MRKKIALIFNNFEDKNFTSGGEKVNYYITKAFSELGYDIDLYCNETIVENIPFIQNIYSPFVWADFFKKKDDYYFSFTEHSMSCGTFSYMHENTRHYRNKYAKRFFEKLIQRIFERKRFQQIQKLEKRQIKKSKYVEKFVVPSEFIKQDIMEAFKITEDRVVLIPPYSNIEALDFTKDDHSVFTFGLSGRGFAHKGGYEFIFSVILLKLLGYKIKAKIIYPFSDSAKKLQNLLNFIGMKNVVEILDYYENMDDFYKQIDCLVMASKREAFGLVAIEAIARSIPIIINNRCGVKDFIKDKNNGFVYDYKYPILNLFSTMKYVLNNQNQLSEICENASEILEQLSFEKFKEKLSKLTP